MQIKTYDDAEVSVLSCTPFPGQLAKIAIDLTQKKLEGDPLDSAAASSGLLGFIISARHGSVVEHCGITFLITGVSRSFLAQITRHRMSSFTSASQHYQDYRDYPMVVHPMVKEDNNLDFDYRIEDTIDIALENSLTSYTTLVDDLGVKPEEARQVLPNASAVNILWTVNARSLENFFYQRLCRRNVSEMRIVVEKLLVKCIEWWPEYFNHVGPACHKGSCDQGKMTCGRVWKREAERQGEHEANEHDCEQGEHK